jgi:hypothetical protein
MVAYDIPALDTHIVERPDKVVLKTRSCDEVDILATFYDVTQMDDLGDVVVLKIWKEDIIVELLEIVCECSTIISDSPVGIRD